MRTLHIVILIISIAGLQSCHQRLTLFQDMSSSRTGIDFVNRVEENDKYNVLNYMNIYTGAGVAAGDINNDGLVDLFFSGNETSCRLYLNKGNMHFEDITEKAGLSTNRWCTGVSMVDINQDGFVTLDEVVALHGASLSDDQIIERLRATGQVFDLTEEQRRYLLDRAVPQNVVDRMVSLNQDTHDTLPKPSDPVVGKRL